MNDQRDNFGPLGQTSTSGFAKEAERAGQRVGAQVGRLPTRQAQNLTQPWTVWEKPRNP